MKLARNLTRSDHLPIPIALLLNCTVAVSLASAQSDTPETLSIERVLSPAIFVFARLHDQQSVSTADIEKQLKRRNETGLSCGAIAQILRSNGVNAVAAQIPLHSVNRLPTPVLLVINDTTAGGAVKRLIVAEKFEGDELVVIDVFPTGGRRRVSAAGLKEFWTGEIVYVPKSWLDGLALRIASRPFVWWVPLGLLIVATWFFASRIRNKHRSAVFVGALVLATTCGCQNQASLEPSAATKPEAIKFSETSTNLGTLEIGDEKVFEFDLPFEVISPSPIQLKQILTSCGCAVISDASPIIDTPLVPGETYRCRIELDLRRRAGSETVEIMLQPKSVDYRPTRISISYFAKQAPAITPKQLALAHVLNEPVPAGLVTISRYRTDDQPMLVIDQERSELAGYQVKIVAHHNIRDQKTNYYQEVMRLELRPPSKLQIRRYENILTFHWVEDVAAPLTLAATVDVFHPVQVMPEAIFWGVVAIGETKTKELRVSCQNGLPGFTLEDVPKQLTVMSVKDGPANSRSIQLRLTAPAEPGRHEDNLKLRFADDRLPEISIMSTMVVRE